MSVYIVTWCTILTATWIRTGITIPTRWALYNTDASQTARQKTVLRQQHKVIPSVYRWIVVCGCDVHRRIASVPYIRAHSRTEPIKCYGISAYRSLPHRYKSAGADLGTKPSLLCILIRTPARTPDNQHCILALLCH